MNGESRCARYLLRSSGDLRLRGLQRRRPLLPQSSRDRFCFCEYTQHVPAGQLAYIIITPASAQQFGDQVWITRHVFETFNELIALRPVEVAADSHVINAG